MYGIYIDREAFVTDAEIRTQLFDKILNFVAAIVNLRFRMYFGISQFAFHIQDIGTENAVIPGKITKTKILPVELG